MVGGEDVKSCRRPGRVQLGMRVRAMGYTRKTPAPNEGGRTSVIWEESTGHCPIVLEERLRYG